MDRRALVYRVLTAVVGIPLLLGAAWLGGWWWAALVAALVGIAALEYAHLNPTTRSSWKIWASGIIYIGPAAAVLVNWGFAARFSVILWFFVVIWINDIAAYFVGHAIGRHKLAPAVSPGKSWEGAIAGLIAGMAAGAGLASFVSPSPIRAAIAGALVTVAAQLGDLFESAIKRRAGVKDSGVIFPGHGGVLDRFDGVFAAAPVAYLLLHWWAP